MNVGGEGVLLPSGHGHRSVGSYFFENRRRFTCEAVRGANRPGDEVFLSWDEGACRPGKRLKTAHQLTPGCRLRSLRSLRPTLAWSRHLLRSKSANAAPRRRVRQPETLCAMLTRPSLAAQKPRLAFDRLALRETVGSLLCCPAFQRGNGVIDYRRFVIQW